ncbi:MAG: hypothetical protein E7072_08905 [Bacteroidales bacterium]|nr:hypothetical protein [Bacteroidales bacterium]
MNLIAINAIVANVIWGECDSPLREHNSSDCHFVGLFSLILPSLIIWVEFDCAEFDLGEFIWCESHSPYIFMGKWI